MADASVVWIGFGVISVVWFFAGGRSHFTGPPGFLYGESHVSERRLEQQQEALDQ